MADRYDLKIDLNSNTSHVRMIRLVGRDKKVLDVGCATGYVAAILTEQCGCVVTGIERNEEAAQLARRVCHRVLCGDAETLEYGREFGNERFDVILFGDALEHFKEPGAVLRRLREFLATDGYVVASIPNVAHAAVALELLKGKFDYRQYGLLDDTHLRFFDVRAVHELFESSGYLVRELDRVKVLPHKTELAIDPTAFPREVVTFALQQDESLTYQFVVKAYPSTESGTVLAVRQTLRAAEQRAELAIAAQRQRIHELEGVVAELRARLKTLEGSVSWRLTAPLRAIRRAIRDRAARPRH